MPDDKDKEFVSFADAHDDWVRQHTPGPLSRLRSSRIFPPREASPGGKALGCFWRIFLFLAAAFVLFELSVRQHLGGNDFADTLADEAKALLKAEEVVLTNLQWKNRVAAISDVQAKGSGASFFHTLRAEGIRFHLPWLMRFRDEWHIESISMLDLEIDFNADLPEEEDKKSNAAAPATPAPFLAAGFGINPRLDTLGFDVLTADKTTFLWGVSPASAGSLEKGAMTLTQAGSNTAFTFTSGVLNQNWLKGLRISKLTFRAEPGAILIDQCEFTVGDSGTGTLKGKIATGEEPVIAIQAELKSVSLADLLPKAYVSHATGVVDLSLKFTGSNATAEGVVCEGTMNLSEGLLKDIRVFESLSTIFAEPRFRRLKVSSGTVEFTTREGKIEIPVLELNCGDFAKLRADLRMKEATPIFTGNLEFGIRPEALTKYPEIADTHFAREEDGLRWASTELQGPVNQLSKELSLKLAEQAREINLKRRGKGVFE